MNNRGYFGIYAQYVYSTPLITQIRFGKWNDILNTPAINASRTYANTIRHVARGMAYTCKHNFTEAEAEAAYIKDSAQSTQLQESPAAFNSGITAVTLAEKILQGFITEEKGNYKTAVITLKEAVNVEDVMLYNEPKDWLLPVRQYLGNILMKAIPLYFNIKTGFVLLIQYCSHLISHSTTSFAHSFL